MRSHARSNALPPRKLRSGAHDDTRNGARAGAHNSAYAALLASCLALPRAEAALVISELDPDQVGTDTAEFVELGNAGPGALSLAGTYVVLVNGADDLSYGAYALPDVVLGAGEAAVLGSVSVLAGLPAGVLGVAAADNFLQNGADAIGLFACAACTGVGDDFPNDSDVFGASFTTAGGHTASRLDALVYGTADADDVELLFGLGLAAGDQLDDAGDGSLKRTALAGLPAEAFTFGAPTPGTLELGVAVVPLPAAFWLLATGLAGLGAIARRKRARPIPARTSITRAPITRAGHARADHAPLEPVVWALSGDPTISAKASS